MRLMDKISIFTKLGDSLPFPFHLLFLDLIYDSLHLSIFLRYFSYFSLHPYFTSLYVIYLFASLCAFSINSISQCSSDICDNFFSCLRASLRPSILPSLLPPSLDFLSPFPFLNCHRSYYQLPHITQHSFILQSTPHPPIHSTTQHVNLINCTISSSISIAA